MKKIVFYAGVIVAVVSTIIVNMLDRGCSLSAETVHEGLLSAVVMADSFGQGTVIYRILLGIIPFHLHEADQAKEFLSALGWPFAIYSLIVGFGLAAYDLKSLTPLQIAGYVLMLAYGAFEIYRSRNSMDRAET